MVALMRRAHERGAKLVVFPELALTTFFPRWFMEDWNEVDAFFEAEMPGPETQRLFDLSRELGRVVTPSDVAPLVERHFEPHLAPSLATRTAVPA